MHCMASKRKKLPAYVIKQAYLQWSDVDDLHAWVGSEHAQHCQLSADGLAGASGRAQQDTLICVVQGVEGLHAHSALPMVSISRARQAGPERRRRSHTAKMQGLLS